MKDISTRGDCALRGEVEMCLRSALVWGIWIMSFHLFVVNVFEAKGLSILFNSK